MNFPLTAVTGLVSNFNSFSLLLIALGLAGLLFYLDPQFPLLVRVMKRQMIGIQITPIFQHLGFSSYSYNVVKFASYTLKLLYGK